ncbi:MAG: Fe3+-hydroxamate ABC transporter substrate-binding protein [Desulfotalea sp.]|nr:MAG: Fe3+-hydroxamate ABC transporter substrate-binding protein [Desulfotalea sp.]
MKYLVSTILLLLSISLCGCKTGDSAEKVPFLQIGEFAINRVSDELTIVRDGAGRSLALIPRGAKAPKGFAPHMIIRVPVQRVVAYGGFDVAALRVLGVLDDTLVGVTKAKEKWFVDDVKRGFDDGRIAFIGDATAINYELLKQQHPELVLTWDPSVIPMLSTLNIPCIITSTPVAMCLNARMSYVKFLAPFFNREQQAEDFFQKVSNSLKDIRRTTEGQWDKTKVMWGDMYEKRVLVEPGNAWIGELVGLVDSDYLFEDVYGTSCIEISMERFLYSGTQANIYFTYRTPKSGATSKAALARLHPLLAKIKPLSPEGKVYAPLPHYGQSGDKLDEIFTEIAAIIHPKLYPNYQLKYFQELPEVDPKGK